MVTHFVPLKVGANPANPDNNALHFDDIFAFPHWMLRLNQQANITDNVVSSYYHVADQRLGFCRDSSVFFL